MFAYPNFTYRQSQADSYSLRANFLKFVECLQLKEKTYNFDKRVQSGTILFVGEGNFSFSLALAKRNREFSANIVASVFEPKKSLNPGTSSNAYAMLRLGGKVLCEIDATKLHECLDESSFDTVVFMFPNVGSRQPKYGRNPNHHLLKRFLRSSKTILKPNGEIAVTLVNRPHYIGAFDVNGAATVAGYYNPVPLNFYPKEFSGYTHTNTNDDDTAISRFRSFSTWVFRPK